VARRKPLRWNIAPDDRVFIAGQTGGGKTYLGRLLVQSVGRLVVLDPNWSISPTRWNLEPWTARNVRKLKEPEENIRLLFRPDAENPPDWDAFYKQLFYIGGLSVYIDEITMALPRKWRTEHTGLHMIYQQGRYWDIRTFGVTQFPSYIPLITFHQSQWFFCFRLIDHDHRERMASAMGKVIKEGEVSDVWPDEHGFWVKHVSWPRSLYYADVESRGQEEEEEEGS
jgi:hypothetical protein